LYQYPTEFFGELCNSLWIFFFAEFSSDVPPRSGWFSVRASTKHVGSLKGKERKGKERIRKKVKGAEPARGGERPPPSGVSYALPHLGTLAADV
jgi:hypothetical protein